MNCDDEDLKAELYSNRAMAFFCLGKDFLIYISRENCVIPAYKSGRTSDFTLTEFGLRTQNFRSQIPAFHDAG